MIIKGHARGRARQLAAHLLRSDQNERIELHECRGTLAKDVEGALVEMEARGLAARTQRPLYHASISPEAATPLKGEEIRQAVDRLEEHLGLHGQPRIIVLHRKKEREHVHVVWSRIDAECGVSIPYSWNYRLHEQASRELEVLFGHRPIENARSCHRGPKSPRPIKDHESRQAERSGVPISKVTDEVTDLWNASHGGDEFRRKLEAAGYVLARGDRRVFVVIDRAGGVHSLARRIRGVDTAALRKRLAHLDLNSLPSVAEARPKIRAVAPRTRNSCRFKMASIEVTRSGSRSRARLPALLRSIFDARRSFAQITRTDEAPPASLKPLHVVRAASKPAASSYRSARALLVADYASKIAAARCHAPRDELEAVLEALYAERQAALGALARKRRGEVHRRRERSHGDSTPNTRLRPRKRRRYFNRRP